MPAISKDIHFSVARFVDWIHGRQARKREERRRDMIKRALIDRLLDLHKRACKTAIRQKLFERWQQQDVVLLDAVAFYRRCTIDDLRTLDARYASYFRSIPSREYLK